jgi:hypothetical protein
MLVLLLATGLVNQATHACGIVWDIPHAYFDGVNAQGKVLYGEKIGELNLGENLKLPINIIFKSDWENNSPYLGQGWMLPLLESRVEQLDENTFRMRLPGGWFQTFWRDTKDKNLLRSGGGWAAQIQGDIITAWADCGWKVVYNKGRITSLNTPNSQTLIYLYTDNNRITELRLDGSPILRVKIDQQGDVSGLEVNNQTISFEYGQKPQVQNIQGQNLIGSITKSVGRVVRMDGTTQTYAYGTTASMEPTLEIGENRLIVWNPKTKVIKKDGEWTYSITPNEKDPYANVETNRVNAKGQQEYWFSENWKGRETIITLDGTKTVKEWFMSGKLSGKQRSYEVYSKDGKLKYFDKFSYNELGDLIKRQNNFGLMEIKTDREKEKIFGLYNGIVVWTKSNSNKL